MGLSSPLLGEMAALLASVGFTLGPTFYTLSGRRIGSRYTLYIRLLFSTLMLMVAHRVYGGTWYPALPWRAWAWLFASGALGLALADIFLFEAFLRIGPRLSMLILTLVPVLSAFMAWAAFAETLTVGQAQFVVLVLAGIAWVVLWGQRPTEESGFRVEGYGLGLAVLAAGLSAVSAVMAKAGLRMVPMHPAAANLVRMSGGMVALWFFGLAKGEWRPLARAVARHPQVLGYLLAGSLAGPVVGMSLQMYAYQTIPLGIALTLTALPPVWLIPVGHLVFRERLTGHAVAGTLLAVVGVVGLLKG